jgi:hypothetical protein
MAELKTGNFLSDWMQDRIYDTVTEDAQGKLNAGPLMGALGGMMGYNVDAIADQKGIDVGNKDAKATLRQIGETRESLGFKKGQDLTGEAVIAKSRENKKAEVKAEKELNRTNEVSDRTAAYGQQTAVAQMGLDAAAANNLANRQQQSDQFAFTSKENSLNRQHEMERGDKRDSLNLQMQVMQNDLAEKRMDYDRETRRMDKRSNAIAQLMSGLGSLGGAFSL